MRRLEENYAVVLVLHPRAAFAVSERAMQEAIAGLSAEAGWPLPRDAARWFWVDVEAERHGRAVRPKRLKVAGSFQPVEVMGALVGLAPREKGFRVRLPSGAEMMLVRERLGPLVRRRAGGMKRPAAGRARPSRPPVDFRKLRLINPGR